MPTLCRLLGTSAGLTTITAKLGTVLAGTPAFATWPVAVLPVTASLQAQLTWMLPAEQCSSSPPRWCTLLGSEEAIALITNLLRVRAGEVEGAGRSDPPSANARYRESGSGDRVRAAKRPFHHRLRAGDDFGQLRNSVLQEWADQAATSAHRRLVLSRH
jgi:hypothetical protein